MALLDKSNIIKNRDSKNNDNQKNAKKTNKNPFFSKKKKATNFEGRNYFVLDLGSRQIKAVEGKLNQKHFQISKMASVTIDDGVYDSDGIKDKTKLVEAIKTLRKNNGFRTKETIVSIDSIDLITREMQIPQMQEEYILDVVKYEISEYLPIDVEKYILQYNVIDTEPVQEGQEQPKMNVVVYALPLEFAEQLYNLLLDLDLDPQVLDIQSDNAEALINRANINGKDLSKGTVAFIDLGYSTINLSIVKDGKHEFNRLIRNNSSIYEAALKTGTYDGKKIEELMEKYKTRNLFSMEIDNSDEIFQDAVIETADKWILDIQKLFKYYTSRRIYNTIDSIYIYGGGSEIKNIDYYIGTRMNTPAWTLNKVEGLSLPQNAKDFGFMRFVNTLSALIGVDKINFFYRFLKQESQAKAEKKSSAFYAVILGLATILAIGLFSYNFFSIKMLNSSIANYQAELSDLVKNKKMQEVTQQSELLDKLKRDRLFLEATDYSLTQINTVSKTLFDTVRRSVSDNLYFTEVSINQGQVKIDGNCSSKMDVAQFEYNLRQTGIFENIYIHSITKKGDFPEYYSFDISFDYNIENESQEQQQDDANDQQKTQATEVIE